MVLHECVFSISRIRAQYRGQSYRINECERCGGLGLLTGALSEMQVISKDSAEFNDAVGFIEFLIQALRE